MEQKHLTSLQHPIVKHLVKVRDDRKYRTSVQSALISGIKLVCELGVRHPLKTLLVTEGYAPPIPIQAEQIVTVSEEIMKKLTALQTPEPLAAEIPLPTPADLHGKYPLLVLDQINDPGNLGTLLRTALALGWKGIFLTPGTTDPFNDKAIRAAKGATFKLPIQQGSYEELFQVIERNKLKLLIADMQGEAIETLTPHQSIALVLGNEANGPDPHLKQAGKAIAIPMDPGMESLNVAAAGAIFMFHLTRKSHG